MIRLLGVLVGSVLAVAALVVFVGIPQVQTESRVTPIGDNGVIRLPERPDPDPVAARLPERPDPDPVAAAEPESAPIVPDRSSEAVVEETIETATAEPVIKPIDVAEEMQQWYAFWSPFRTEIAANGFVTQLQRVTGLDYRVVKVKTGVYEVAFAYGNDDEVMTNLSQISAATGLQLPEG